jgi:outer membrane protein TolC
LGRFSLRSCGVRWADHDFLSAIAVGRAWLCNQSLPRNHLARLSAEPDYQQILTNLVQAQSNHYVETAALFQALGGWWKNRPGIPKP